MQTGHNRCCRTYHTACAGHAGSSFGWRKAQGNYAKAKSRYAWPDMGGGVLLWNPLRHGPVDMAQVDRRRRVAGGGDKGQGGATSTPNPKPSDGSSGGKGQGTKRA